MVSGFSAAVQTDTLKYLHQFEHPHLDGRFLKQFAAHSFPQRFSYLKKPTRNRPLILERRAAASYEQNAPVGNYDPAHSDERPVWELAAFVHPVREPPHQSLTRALYNTPVCCQFALGGTIAVTRCPECDAEIDLDEDEVEEGEILTCPECDTELEVTQTHPVHLIALSDDEEEAGEEEDDEGAEEDEEEEESGYGEDEDER